MNETIHHYRAQKAQAIMNSIMNTATTVLQSAPIAYPHKRIFRKIDRRPVKRINKNRARLQMIMALPMGAMQVAMIASQPVRKYERGGVSGIVGETGKAEIINRKP